MGTLALTDGETEASRGKGVCEVTQPGVAQPESRPGGCLGVPAHPCLGVPAHPSSGCPSLTLSILGGVTACSGGRAQNPALELQSLSSQTTLGAHVSKGRKLGFGGGGEGSSGQPPCPSPVPWVE